MNRCITSKDFSVFPKNNISFSKLNFFRDRINYISNHNNTYNENDNIQKVFGDNTTTEITDWEYESIDSRPIEGFGNTNGTWTIESTLNKSFTISGAISNLTDNNLTNSTTFYFDGSSEEITEYNSFTLSYDAGNTTNNRVIEYRLYCRISTNTTEAFPKKWILRARNNLIENWTELDNQDINAMPISYSTTANNYQNEFAGGIIDNPDHYRYYQFVFTDYFNYSDGGISSKRNFSLGEVVFYTDILPKHNNRYVNHYNNNNNNILNLFDGIIADNVNNMIHLSLNTTDAYSYNSNVQAITEQYAISLKYISPEEIIPFEYRVYPRIGNSRFPIRWKLLASLDDINYDLLDSQDTIKSELPSLSQNDFPNYNYQGNYINYNFKKYKYFKFIFTLGIDDQLNLATISEIILYKYVPNNNNINLNKFNKEIIKFSKNKEYRYYYFHFLEPYDHGNNISLSQLAFYKEENNIDKIVLGAGKTTSTNLMFYSNTPNNDNINVDFSPQYTDGGSGAYVWDNINELFDNKIIRNEGFHNKSSSLNTELDADPQGSSYLLIDFNKNPTSIDKYRIWPRPEFNTTQAPGSLRLYSSNTNVNTNIDPFLSYTNSDYLYASFPFKLANSESEALTNKITSNENLTNFNATFINKIGFRNNSTDYTELDIEPKIETDYTICIRYKRTGSIANYQVLLGTFPDDSNTTYNHHTLLWYQGNTSAELRFQHYINNQVRTAISIPNGLELHKWFTVFGVFEGTTMKIYADNDVHKNLRLVGTVNNLQTGDVEYTSSKIDKLRLGNRIDVNNSSADRFEGDISDFYIFKKGLSFNECYKWYNFINNNYVDNTLEYINDQNYTYNQYLALGMGNTSILASSDASSYHGGTPNTNGLFNNSIGDYTTGWHSSGNPPHYIRIQLKREIILTKIIMWPRWHGATGYSAQFISDFTLYAGNTAPTSVSDISNMTPIYTKVRQNYETLNYSKIVNGSEITAHYYHTSYPSSSPLASNYIDEGTHYYIDPEYHHKYKYFIFKLNHSSNSSNLNEAITIGEIAFYSLERVSPDRLILGAYKQLGDATIQTSSNYSGTSGEQLFDNDIGSHTTGWHSTATTGDDYFLLDLKEQKKLSKFYFWSRVGFGVQIPTKFILFASNTQPASVSSTSGMTPIYIKIEQSYENATNYDRNYIGSKASDNFLKAIKYYIPVENQEYYRYYIFHLQETFSDNNKCINEIALFERNENWDIIDEQISVENWPSTTSGTYASEQLNNSLLFTIGNNNSNKLINNENATNQISINNNLKNKNISNRKHNISNLLVHVNPSVSTTRTIDSNKFFIERYKSSNNDIKVELDDDNVKYFTAGPDANQSILRIKRNGNIIPRVPDLDSDFTLVFTLSGNYGNNSIDTRLFSQPLYPMRYNHYIQSHTDSLIFHNVYPGFTDVNPITQGELGEALPLHYNNNDKYIIVYKFIANYPGNNSVTPNMVFIYVNGELKSTIQVERFNSSNGYRVSNQEMLLFGFVYFSSLDTPNITSPYQVYGTSSYIRLYDFKAYLKGLNNEEINILSGGSSKTYGGEIKRYTIDDITYESRTFISSNTFIVNEDLGECDILLVGGGGGSGNRHRGGAGAGGLVYISKMPISKGEYNIVVGAGGTGAPLDSATNGGDTIAFNYTAKGGGASTVSLPTGGSNPGYYIQYSESNISKNITQNLYQNDLYAKGYGNLGGNAIKSPDVESSHASGGGGGAGGRGGDATITGTNYANGGCGGPGRKYNLRTGEYEYYAGGGGEGISGKSTGTAGLGGLGGGGSGGNNSGEPGYDGLNGTGGGGGGGGWTGGTNASGGNGGSGIVIIRYKIDEDKKFYENKKLTNLTVKRNHFPLLHSYPFENFSNSTDALVDQIGNVDAISTNMEFIPNVGFKNRQSVSGENLGIDIITPLSTTTGFTVYMKYRHDAFSTYWTRLISFKDISGNEVGTLMEESESINNGKIELFGVIIDDAYVTGQFSHLFLSVKNGTWTYYSNSGNNSNTLKKLNTGFSYVFDIYDIHLSSKDALNRETFITISSFQIFSDTSDKMIYDWYKFINMEQNWVYMSNLNTYEIMVKGGTINNYLHNNVLYRSHTFSSSDTITFLNNVVCDILVIGGGGGGARQCNQNNAGNGGGGAGGLVYINSKIIQKGNYNIVIGAGGSRSTHNYYGNVGNSGNNSSAFDYIANGGGRGGIADNTSDTTAYSGGQVGSAQYKNSEEGGSGGGGGRGTDWTANNSGSNSNQNKYLSDYYAIGYGNKGGDVSDGIFSGLNRYSGGGGGGAGGEGEDGNNYTIDSNIYPISYGGIGKSYNLQKGVDITYCTGGLSRIATNLNQTTNPGDGGFSGDGSNVIDGTGSVSEDRAAQSGIDGVVILRYKLLADNYNYPIIKGGDITTYKLNNKLYRSHTFKSSDTLYIFDHKNVNFDILLVGGGGGGGYRWNGGGGGGGVTYVQNKKLLNENYIITIGQGGLGRTTSTSSGSFGNKSEFVVSSLNTALNNLNVVIGEQNYTPTTNDNTNTTNAYYSSFDVNVSESYNSDYSPRKMFDNSNTSGWASFNTPTSNSSISITIDFNKSSGNSELINVIKIWAWNDVYSNKELYCIGDLLVKGSNDNSSFDTLGTFNFKPGDYGLDTASYSFSSNRDKAATAIFRNSRNYRYYKLEILNLSGHETTSTGICYISGLAFYYNSDINNVDNYEIVKAIGGGSAGADSSNSKGLYGGSGGGGKWGGVGGKAATISGLPSEARFFGNDGGSDVSGSYYNAAGGGGAGIKGENGITSKAGDGGDGLLFKILDGTDIYYAGGGGGGGHNPAGERGIGGLGGGGNGGTPGVQENGEDGADNTGGGGGGAGTTSSGTNRGGNGGSGICIIRYPLNEINIDELDDITDTEIVAVGGTTTEYSLNGNLYKSHTFLTTDKFYISTTDKEFDILIVGGGGGGATRHRGAGGAGGLVYVESKKIKSGIYNIVIGKGGNGGTTTNSFIGFHGTPSSAFKYIAKGGGGGGHTNSSLNTSYDLGCTGGGKVGEGNFDYNSLYSNQDYYEYDKYATGYSNVGGRGIETPSSQGYFIGGGGGGVGSKGGDSTTSVCGSGGDGLSFNIRDGTNIYYGGGGGEGLPSTSTLTAGLGGLGGGGNGGKSSSQTGGNGTSNTGGGGGGGGWDSNANASGGNGGSGIVIIRYKI